MRDTEHAMTDTNTTTTKRPTTASFSYEITDTFGGEANYCWVRRGAVRARSVRGAIRAIKAREGIVCRHPTDSYGGDYACVDFTRGGWLACMFITVGE
jgi:hypothetical protein